ncbi:MAG TPA: TolC family protein [Candidatus Baltobacteraceae bacterium]|nr:TolC family protein [Candidatus Baltobacteraceae bacterium]
MIAAIVFAAVVSAQQFSALPLDAALRAAVAHSPDVEQARQRVRENAALLAAAKGGAAPSLTANYAAAPQAGNDNNTVIQQLTTVGGQVTLGDYLAYAPLVRQAAFTLAGAQSDLIEAQRAERLKSAGLYFSVLKAIAALQLREQDYAGRSSDMHAAQLRYRAGDAPRIDVVRAQVALASAQADLDAARVDLANAQNALEVETGSAPAAFAQLQPLAQPAPVPANADAAVTRALLMRSDLASAKSAIAAEEAAVDATRRGFFPAVTVSAGYTSGVDTGIAVHGPSANVTLSVPVSRAQSARVEAEQARLDEARAKAEGIRRQIVLDVGSAARTYAETLRAQISAARARAAAQAELRATQVGYRNGASSSLDVSDARRTYLQAALNEVSAVYAAAQAQAVLEEEIGP